MTEIQFPIIRRIAPLVATAMALAACAPPRPRASEPAAMAPAAADRTTPPPVGAAPRLRLPPIQEFSLSNGMRVLLLEKRDLPLVQANVLIDAGSVRDDASLTGLASMTAAMLAEGAAGRSSLEIADAFELLGARFYVAAGSHLTEMSLRVPSARLPEALTLAADVLLRPDFPQRELDRLRSERLTALVRRHDKPAAIADVLSDATLFGPSHPYGRQDVGSAASLRSLTTAELRHFHQRLYRPNNATAIVVGDIDRATAQRLLEGSLSRWAPGEVAPVRVPEAPQARSRTLLVVDKPGSAQSVIRLGRVGVPRSTSDYFALEVMNVILGGSFTSRLNQNLREDKGYTYGAGSGFVYRPSAGPWYASAAVQTHSTGPAIGEFIKELRGMHEPIPDEEVARARSFLAMRYPSDFQSVEGIADGIGELVEYGLPLDYFNRYVDGVLSVTRADVERVARQYIDPENVLIVVVGDRRAIEQQVREQNLGEVRFLSVADVLGPVPVLQ